MSIRVAHRSVGMRRARRVLRQLEALGQDPSELLSEIGQTLVDSAERRINRTNVGPDGKSWPVSRRAAFKGGPTQYDSGDLSRSLLYRVLPDALEMGSPLLIAAQRQFGGTILPKRGRFLVFRGLDEAGEERLFFARKVTQPARPYLGVSDDDAEEIGALSAEFLDAIMRPGPGESDGAGA